MSEKSFEKNNELKVYFGIFGWLLIFTVITVALSLVHVNVYLSVTLGLIVATLKASLVAAYFMHLHHEKKLIYVILGFTFFFFINLVGLIVYGPFSVPEGTINLNKDVRYKPSIHDSGHHSPASHEEPSTESHKEDVKHH